MEIMKGQEPPARMTLLKNNHMGMHVPEEKDAKVRIYHIDMEKVRESEKERVKERENKKERKIFRDEMQSR